MAQKRIMQRFAQWHIWLGWLVGVPIVLWLASGLFMTLRPITEVRGEHLRIERPEQALVIEGSPLASEGAQIKDMRLTMQDGRAVAILTTLDGVTSRVDYATGEPIPALDAEGARALVAKGIVGGDTVASVTCYNADEGPVDIRRRAVPVWRVALEDGTYVYVGRDTGRIEAVRTRWWRWFDFAWGVHIMDLSEREDNSHPILIGFAGLSLVGALIGCVLMFRRRKARVKAPPTDNGMPA